MAKLGELDVEQFLHDAVQIEPLALQEEYIRVAPDLAYFNERYSRALERSMIAKLAVDQTEARLQIAVRQALLNTSQKITEALVEASVTTHEDMTTAREEQIQADVEKSRLHGVLDAIRTKRDMLVSLGAHVRSELQGDPSLRVQAQNVRLRNDSLK